MTRTCVMNWLMLVVSCVTVASSREKAFSPIRVTVMPASAGGEFQLFLSPSARNPYVVALDPRHPDPRLDLGLLPRQDRLPHPLRPENGAPGGPGVGGDRPEQDVLGGGAV